jgi:hypothetical protein
MLPTPVFFERCKTVIVRPVVKSVCSPVARPIVKNLERKKPDESEGLNVLEKPEDTAQA